MFLREHSSLLVDFISTHQPLHFYLYAAYICLRTVLLTFSDAVPRYRVRLGC